MSKKAFPKLKMTIPLEDPNSKKKKQREGKRFALGLRVTEERRRQLENAAKKSGRSLSQELEMLIEHAFRDEVVLGGREMMVLFRTMAGVAQAVEARFGRRWSADREIYAELRKAWEKIIDEFEPPSWSIDQPKRVDRKVNES